MATISAPEVKTLRTQTGAGMMDCKRALTDADGDPERAIEILRERGLAKAGKRSGRSTSEGQRPRIWAPRCAACVGESGSEAMDSSGFLHGVRESVVPGR